MTDTLRYGLIGVGGAVFGMHEKALQQMDGIDIVAVVDINEAAAQKVAEAWGSDAYTDYRQMIDDVQPDVVVVMVPHMLHPEMTIYALHAGAHVLVEKPLAMHIGDADAMLRAAEESGKLLGVNYQQRTRPEIVAAKQLLDSGEIGRVQHIDVKMHWTRGSVYYTVVDWRGKWKTEGGAVLLNQGIHELDLTCYLMGLPERVFGWTRTILHDIECEDTIQAIAEWGNGALGSIHLSTAEAGHKQRIEIVGTEGNLNVYEGGRVELRKLDTPIDQFLPSTPDAFSSPGIADVHVEVANGFTGKHYDIHQNFYDAITKGMKLLGDPQSSAWGLELANAITYSSYMNQPVEFPLDRDAYLGLLKDLQKGKRS